MHISIAELVTAFIQNISVYILVCTCACVNIYMCVQVCVYMHECACVCVCAYMCI